MGNVSLLTSLDFKPLIFSKLQFQPRVTRGWVGGRREGVGGVGWEEAKAPQVKTRGPELSTDGPDGPDHTTRP